MTQVAEEPVALDGVKAAFTKAAKEAEGKKERDEKQIEANIDAYGKVYRRCLKEARAISADIPVSDRDTVGVATTLFNRYWDDQNTALDRNAGNDRNDGLLSMVQQMRGGRL